MLYGATFVSGAALASPGVAGRYDDKAAGCYEDGWGACGWDLADFRC